MIFILTAGLIFNFINLNPKTAEAATTDNLRTITVFGEGQVKAKPDLALVSLGVQNEAASANTAQEANSRAMQNVVSKLKQLGIKEEDMQTSRYNIYPYYDYSQEKAPKLAGYRANSVITIKIKDLEKVGDVIDAGVEAGANSIEEVRFTIENDRDLYLQALEAAAKDASAKAASLTKAFGISLKQIRTIEELGGSRMDFISQYGVEKEDMVQRVSATPIIPGSVTVSVQIKVVYDL